MFDRFTNQARTVIVQASAEARALGHPYIGTEHLLLALLDPDAGIAYLVLQRAGVDAGRVRGDVRRLTAARPDALTAEDAAALEAIGIDLPTVLARIEGTLGPSALAASRPSSRRRRLMRRRQVAASGCVPFTGRAKKVLDLSLREGVALRHQHIGPEHILLGLLREGEGLAARVLSDTGVDLGQLRRATLAALDAAA